MKNIESNNRLISEYFRGKKPPPNRTWDYHQSWDSLMPLIDKIMCEEKTMFYFTGPNYVPGMNRYSFSISPESTNPVKEQGLTMLEIAYEGVVEYIKNR